MGLLARRFVHHRGEREACQDICQAMIEWATPRQLGRLADFAHHVLAQAALAAGDFEEGYAHAVAINPPGTFRSHSLQALWVALDLIDAAVHTGRNDEARAHAEAMQQAHLSRLSPRLELITAAARAMVASDDEAPGLFGAALAVPGIKEWPFGAVVTLARAFLPGMLARGSGGILNIGSTIAFQPAPYQAVYGANKAFVLSFSQALWEEARAAGVAVTALCPGPTRTGFVDALGWRTSPRSTSTRSPAGSRPLCGRKRGRGSPASTTAGAGSWSVSCPASADSMTTHAWSAPACGTSATRRATSGRPHASCRVDPRTGVVGG